MHGQLSTRILTLLFLLTLAVGVRGGIFLDRQLLGPAAPSPGLTVEATPEFQSLVEASQIIRGQYVDRERVGSRPLAHAAIGGMVDSLDDGEAARFLTPQMAQRKENHVHAKFAGIGLYVEMRDGRAVIIAPFDDSPADRSSPHHHISRCPARH
jgi:carboxyl-terminal processing protease